MSEQYLIGIDVGTTGTKAILFSKEGACLKSAYQGYPLSTPQVGHVEQDPADWWQAVGKTVREVSNGYGDKVCALSLSTQGGTMVCADKKGNPLTPAFVWNDSRCDKEAEAFASQFGADAMYQKTGWALFAGMPAMQIRWVKDNLPDVFRQTALFLTVPDFLSLRMTGKAAVDYSNAGINQLIDVREGRYDKALLDFAGIDEGRLPALVPSGTAIGKLTEEAAAFLGLSTDTLLISGAHDQYAVALGAGATHPGDILIGSGTAWVVTAIEEKPDFSGLSQSRSAINGLWGSLCSLSHGGVCLDWLRKNIVGTQQDPLDYETLNREVAQRKAAEEGLFFFPFGGKQNKARFEGLDLSHDRFHLARAVMEGVVFQILQMLERFPSQPGEAGLLLAGGASKSPVWSKLLSDISGLPVRIPQMPDLACVGAAILAGFGAGLYSSPEEGHKRLCVPEQTIYSDPEATKTYAPLFAQYKEYQTR